MRKYLLFILCAFTLWGCEKSDSSISTDTSEIGTITQNKKASASTLADFPANPVTKSGWTLTKQDEFGGTGLNQNLWIPYYLRHRVGEDASAMADWEWTGWSVKLRIQQSKLGYGGGNMRVSSFQTLEKTGLHQSGSNGYNRTIPTKVNFVQKYGYFEIRAKVQAGSGHCSTFWLVGQQNNSTETAEIDIMEKPGNKQDNEFKFNLYRWGDTNITNANLPFNSTVGGGGWGYTLAPTPDLTSTFNIYALEWNATEIKMYFNNVLVKTISKSPQYPMGILLSLYESRNANDWYGNTINSNMPYNKYFEIDYFRAYRKN